MISKNLKQIRQARGLSLDALSRLCGVSPSMLGQIERGESSPTVATLQKLVSALRVSYEELLEGGSGETELIDPLSSPAYRERAGKYRLSYAVPYDRRRRFAQVYARIAPGQVCGRIDESAEYAEYVFVQDGELLLRVESSEYHIRPGQGARIPRGAEHVYCNRGDGELSLLITLSYEE